MHCIVCKSNKFSPTIPPFEIYCCDNYHLQCNKCTAANNGKCVTCAKCTTFIHVGNNSTAMDVGDRNQRPTTTPSLNVINDISEATTKAIFVDAQAKSTENTEYESLNVKDTENLDDEVGSKVTNHVSESNNNRTLDESPKNSQTSATIKDLEYYWSTWSQIPTEYASFYEEKPWLQKINKNRATEEEITNLHQLLAEAFETIQEPQFEKPSGSRVSTLKKETVATELIGNKKEENEKQTTDIKLQRYLEIRAPIMCPEYGCKRYLNLSDFASHIITAHRHIPKEIISPLEYKNLILDAQSTSINITKCHVICLLKNKIINMGDNEYKNFLPLLVMASRIDLEQIFNDGQEEQKENNKDENDYEMTNMGTSLLIWIENPISDKVPVWYTLNVLENTDLLPKCYATLSGEAFSARHAQDAVDVFNNGQSLLLSEEEIDNLTRCGRNMLCLQLIAH